MIISHKYKYVFVQVPRTASSSIGIELCDNYGGEPILHKHAKYDEFLKNATHEEKNYLVFAGVRNPLDCLVTEYFRRKAGERTEENGLHLEKYIFIRDNNASFPDFMKKYHFHFHRPDRSFYRGTDFVYKYENLQEDFSRILKKLGIEQIRSLPQSNRTTGKIDSYLSYYTEDIQLMIRIVFRKKMKRSGYEFPADWVISPGKSLFIFLAALAKTVVFTVKIAIMRYGKQVNPGSHDLYTQRVKNTYINERDSGDGSNTSDRTK